MTIFRLPWLKPPLTQNMLRRRGHWSVEAKQKKLLLSEARLTIVQAGLPNFDSPVEVTLVFVQPDRRVRDADGLAPTLKIVLDALVLEGILTGDDWRFVPKISIEIRPATNKKHVGLFCRITPIVGV